MLDAHAEPFQLQLVVAVREAEGGRQDSGAVLEVPGRFLEASWNLQEPRQSCMHLASWNLQGASRNLQEPGLAPLQQATAERRGTQDNRMPTAC